MRRTSPKIGNPFIDQVRVELWDWEFPRKTKMTPRGTQASAAGNADQISKSGRGLFHKMGPVLKAQKVFLTEFPNKDLTTSLRAVLKYKLK